MARSRNTDHPSRSEPPGVGDVSGTIADFIRPASAARLIERTRDFPFRREPLVCGRRGAARAGARTQEGALLVRGYLPGHMKDPPCATFPIAIPDWPDEPEDFETELDKELEDQWLADLDEAERDAVEVASQRAPAAPYAPAASRRAARCRGGRARPPARRRPAAGLAATGRRAERRRASAR